MRTLRKRREIDKAVRKAVEETPVLDIHTHLYPPSFGELLLWGVDELLTYHYLVAELFRHHAVPYEQFWAMSKSQQADLVWEHLFLRNSPISEACRGALTALRMLGFKTDRHPLARLRAQFAEVSLEEHLDSVFSQANVSAVIMTNDPFDELERPVWLNGPPRAASPRGGRGVLSRGALPGSTRSGGRSAGLAARLSSPKSWPQPDDRFRAVLRLDSLLMKWPQPVKKMNQWGYRVRPELTDDSLSEVKRFLQDWIQRMDAVYVAVSLPPSFRFPEDSDRSRLIEHAVLPVAREQGVPLAMMIGVNKLVNPGLQVAGDAVGKADNSVLERMCRDFPRNRFLVTYLSRENQHELCVTARKFHNLHPFGCWWFLNNPSIVEEITRERVELLGTSFTPQHSDARVLEQLLYKWRHSRRVIAKVLVEKYGDMAEAGWEVTEEHIRRDVAGYFGGAFERFLADARRA